MPSSLFSGVSGLRSFQDQLDVVGNDLANENTTGFKSQRVRFGDLLYQTLAQATSSTNSQVGGTNPIQVGFGVKVQAIDQNMGQGSLQSTGGDLDVAIQGNGFFTVNNGTQNLYTRSGAFGVDEHNFLVDPTTGFHVQRFGATGEGTPTSPAFQTPGNESINIPLGTGIPGKASTTVILQGNLSANAVGPLAQTLTTAQPFTAGGAPATLGPPATLINSLDDSNHKYQAGDQIVISGTRVDGTPIPAGTALTFSGNPPTQTIGDLITAINAAFGPGASASLDASGNLVLKAAKTGPANALSLTLADGPNNQGGSLPWTNHGLAATTVGKNGDAVTSAIQIFDTQGNAHTLSLVFTKQGSNVWDLSGTVAASEGTVISGTVKGLTFNDDGSFRQIAGVTQTMSFQFTGLANPQTISFNFGTGNGFNGLTQFGGNSSAAATSQDGFAAGFLTSLSIGKQGLISGVFTNGRTLDIAQLDITSFANPAGLDRIGDNYFSLSNHSGDPLAGTGEAGGRGSIQQGALESSNVDVAQEFTELITAERGFQINSRTITVSDQVLSQLASIIQ
jgi:flagellar hook protein FlgE